MPTKELKKEYVSKSFRYNGKQYNVKGKNEADALKKKAEKLAALKRGEEKLKPVTVKDWSELWLATYIKPKVRKPGEPKFKGSMTQKSYEMYEQKLNNYIIPAIGKMKMVDVKDVHLQQILNKEAGGSFSTVSKIRLVIKAMFKQAYASRVIVYDPSIYLSLPNVQKGTRRSITDYERQILLDVARSHRCGLWIRFLLYSGLRPAESAALKVKHLDFENELIEVKEALESGSDIISDPKSAAGTRYVFISPEIIADLKQAIEGKTPEDFVFPQTDGKTMMTAYSMNNNWRSFSRQMDLAMGAETTVHGHIYDPKDILPDGKAMYPEDGDEYKPKNGHKIASDLVPYCLRHTFCTDLGKKGVPIEDIKYLMGHEDITTTLGIYSHPDKETAERAAKVIKALADKEKENSIT